MKNLLLLTLMAALGTAAVPAQELNLEDPMQKPQKFTRKITRTAKLNYLLYLPKGHLEKGRRKSPLLLFLHGAGERGTNIWKVAVHGPPKLVRTKTQEFPFVIVSPQCPEGEHWDPEVLMALVDEVIKKQNIDSSRVYVTGLSMGGYGTWALAARYPARFAAVAPICGGGETIGVLLADAKRKEAMKTLGVWAFHGAKDPVVKLEESERMIAAYKRIGADAKLTVYPEAQHDSWTETYLNPELYTWLLNHSR